MSFTKPAARRLLSSGINRSTFTGFLEIANKPREFWDVPQAVAALAGTLRKGTNLSPSLSHRRIVQSSAPLTTVLPSPLNRTEFTNPVCPTSPGLSNQAIDPAIMAIVASCNQMGTIGNTLTVNDSVAGSVVPKRWSERIGLASKSKFLPMPSQGRVVATSSKTLVVCPSFRLAVGGKMLALHRSRSLPWERTSTC